MNEMKELYANWDKPDIERQYYMIPLLWET